MKKDKTSKNNVKEGHSKDKLEVVEENLSVDKKEVQKGKVTLTKRVIEEEVPLSFTGIEEEIEIDVKKVGRVVEEPGKAVRTEGDSTIYSVYREVYVKQTILEEEVWVTRKTNTKTYESPQKLKREVIDVQRSSGKPGNDNRS